MSRFARCNCCLLAFATLTCGSQILRAQLQPEQPAFCAHTQKNLGKDHVSPQVYQKWLDEDVAYVINDQERTDFAKLTTDEQRDKFVEAFWQRRNPTPGSSENTFKEEHYRRIAYANEHFAANMPGWKTDRGRIYIIYGPPDKIDRHFSAAGSNKASDLVGVGQIPYDWELWHYRYIDGLGKNVNLRFVDTCSCGRYEMPVTKEDLNKYKPK